MPLTHLIASTNYLRCRHFFRSVYSVVPRKPIVVNTNRNMIYPMSITFLGTSSGGGPTENRNCSSLVCDFFEGNNMWMVDCAEGTTRQFVLQPNRPGVPRVRISQITKLFVTHMHADHIMGIPTLLRNVLRAPRVDAHPLPSNAIEHRKFPILQIYGPCGLRSFIRQNLKMTFTRCDETYVVHELLKDSDPITPCNPPPDPQDPDSGFDYKSWDILHCNEVPGQDIQADEQGLWHNITSQNYGKRSTQVSIHAGPIHHREPCIGYVFDETTSPRRKIVVLGDTHDPSPIIPLCTNPNPTLLVHEATDSTISPGNDKNGRLSKRKLEDVMKTTLARGHSTPMMAGEFAKCVNAQKLVLNHIGSRFPAPRVGDSRRGFTLDLLDDMEQKATTTWGPLSGNKAIVALDFMRILVPEPINETMYSTQESPSFSLGASTGSPPTLPHPLPAKPLSSLEHKAQHTNNPINNHNSSNPTVRNNQAGLVGNNGFQGAPSGLPGSMPIQTTGQPGYYGQLLGYDPFQAAQSFLAFAQMMQVGAGVGGTGMVDGPGMGTGMGTGIGMELGMHPDRIGGIPILMLGGGDIALAGVVGQPRGQPRAAVTGNLEQLERDPVIARSIAAANTRYETEPSGPWDKMAEFQNGAQLSKR